MLKKRLKNLPTGNLEYTRAKKPLTTAVIKSEFLSTYDPDNRNEKLAARSKLLSGACTMQKFDGVKQYMQEFLQLVRQAVDLSSTDQTHSPQEGNPA